MNTHRRIPTVLASLAFALFAIAGCTDNPVTPEEHAEPVGLVVFEGQTEIVRVEESVVTGAFDLLNGAVSPLYTLQFIDEEGDLFVPDDPDFAPDAIVADATVVEVVRGDPADWDFRLRGLKTGTTSIRLVILHGGHEDFTSPEIPVTVTQ